MVQTVTVPECLELAAAAHFTSHAEMVALGKQQFQHKLAGTDHLGGLGLDLHAVGDREGASRLQGALAGYFHQTHPAATAGGKGRVMTERGDVNAGGLRSLEHGLAGPGGYLLSVDRQRDRAHISASGSLGIGHRAWSIG